MTNPNPIPIDLPVRFTRPTLPPLDEILRHYGPSFESAMLTNSGAVLRLEQEVAERLGVAHCVAVASCTAGLILVLKALGVTGEVILPSFTFFATGHAVLWCGLTPVFADCDPSAWTLDAADVEAKMTDRTGAILGVHLYGNAAPIAELEDLARRRGVKLIFDAAHAFGSSYRGSLLGGFGDAEVFSLSPTKLLVAGEGGLVCTHDATLARRMRAARNYGDSGNYDPELLGLNARMTEFNAAMALAGLDRTAPKLDRHNHIASRYTEILAGTPGLGLQNIPEGNRSGYKDFSILISRTEFGMSRDDVAEALRALHIETRKYFSPALHQQKLFAPKAGQPRAFLPQTERIAEEVLSLPIYESLPEETVDRIAQMIRSLHGQSLCGGGLPEPTGAARAGEGSRAQGVVA